MVGRWNARLAAGRTWFAGRVPAGERQRSRQGWTRAVGHGLIIAGLLVGAYVFFVLAPEVRTVGYDAFAYWYVSLPEPYEIPWFLPGSFSYAPPMALIADTFSAVEWWVFWFLWTMLLVGTVIWIGGSPLWILAAFAVPAVAIELYHGNIHILLAAAVVLGFRHPWTWSFVLLTKPTAAVGLLWFAVRREWRELGTALGATLLLCAVSWLVLPSLWADWFDLLRRNVGLDLPGNTIPIPLWIRLPIAALLVIWGARTDRRWTVVVAATLALPALWIAGLAMLIGVIPEVRRHPSSLWRPAPGRG